MPASSPELDRWNQKYRASPGSWLEHDPFLPRAFSEYIHPLFPAGGNVLDLAGGAGRHAIWLARQGWEVTLIDIAEEGLALARKNAEGVVSQIHFVLDDLSHFRAAQAQFDLVIAFFFLERSIFPQIVKAIRPGGLLVYKTLTRAQLSLPGGPRDPAHLLEEGELQRLAETEKLQVLHYREQITAKATAELVARKIPLTGCDNSHSRRP